jgi:hypothetical protein
VDIVPVVVTSSEPGSIAGLTVQVAGIPRVQVAFCGFDVADRMRRVLRSNCMVRVLTAHEHRQ